MGTDPLPVGVRPGLYVHVPFCARKCAYCAFASSESRAGRASWVADLLREAAMYADDWAGFDTIYIGGGTPTVLADEAIHQLLMGLRTTFTMNESVEVTLEANPDDLDMERPRRLRELGVDRLSMGVQSFDDALLLRLGRRHDARGARRALDAVAMAGFSSFSIDLMYGLPGQGLEQGLADLATALEWEPHHLSCYLLSVEPGTPFHRQGIRALADDAAADRFLATSTFLRERDWQHYEVSNFARTPRHASRHNTKYWFHVPYLGLGPSAHSFRRGERWWNLAEHPSWQHRISRGESPVAERETLTPSQIRLETLALGLRTAQGVPRGALGPSSGPALEEAVRLGLLVEEDGWVRPTMHGYLLADRLPLRFWIQ